MLGDIFLIAWVAFMAIYFLVMKFRYDDVIAKYVKVKMLCSKSSFLSCLVSFLS